MTIKHSLAVVASLTCLCLVGCYDVFITTRRDWYDDDNRLINISFTRHQFKDLYECLCQATTQQCSVQVSPCYWNPCNAISNATFERQQHPNDDLACKHYQCDYIWSSFSFVCIQKASVSRQSSLTTQSIRYQDVDCGGTQCVAFSWRLSGESVDYSRVQGTVSSCDHDCECATGIVATPAVESTLVKSTTVESTAVPPRSTAVESTAVESTAVELTAVPPRSTPLESTAVDSTTVESTTVESTAVPPRSTAVESKAVPPRTTAVESTSVESTTVESTAVELTAVPPRSTAVESTAVDSTTVESTIVESTAVPPRSTAVESKAVESTTVESTAVESTTVESTAVESTTVESTAVESTTVELTAVPPGSTAVESKAVESTTVESTAVESTTVESKAVPPRSTATPRTTFPVVHVRLLAHHRGTTIRHATTIRPTRSKAITSSQTTTTTTTTKSKTTITTRRTTTEEWPTPTTRKGTVLATDSRTPSTEITSQHTNPTTKANTTVLDLVSDSQSQNDPAPIIAGVVVALLFVAIIAAAFVILWQGRKGKAQTADSEGHKYANLPEAAVCAQESDATTKVGCLNQDLPSQYTNYGFVNGSFDYDQGEVKYPSPANQSYSSIAVKVHADNQHYVNYEPSRSHTVAPVNGNQTKDKSLTNKGSCYYL